MKKRVIGYALRKDKDYKISSVSVGLGGMNFYITIKGLCNKEFLIGGMYGLSDPDLLQDGRHNVEFIELSPYRGAPKLYNEALLEQYHVIELCEKFGVSHPVTNGIKISLAKSMYSYLLRSAMASLVKSFYRQLKPFVMIRGLNGYLLSR